MGPMDLQACLLPIICRNINKEKSEEVRGSVPSRWGEREGGTQMPCGCMDVEGLEARPSPCMHASERSCMLPCHPDPVQQPHAPPVHACWLHALFVLTPLHACFHAVLISLHACTHAGD